MPAAKDVNPNVVESIDIDHELIKVTDAYNDRDKLFEKWPTDQEIPEMMRPSDHIQSIKDAIKEIYETTACYDCPMKLLCNKRVWGKGCEFAKVIGCSGHPDQKRFKGHSTVVVLTDLTESGQLQFQSSSWSLCRTTASCDSFNQVAITPQSAPASAWYIARGLLIQDTSSIPGTADVTNAIFRGYCATGYLTYYMDIQDGQPNYPHDPVVVSDYDYAQHSGSYGYKVSSEITYPAWNDWAFSDVSVITVGGITKHYIKNYTHDIANSSPAGNNYREFEGPTHAGGHDPKMEITYNTPAAGLLARFVNAGGV